jgi:hypothetical protein
MIEELEVVADFRRVNSRGFDVLAGETEGEWRFGNGRVEVSRPRRGSSSSASGRSWIREVDGGR